MTFPQYTLLDKTVQQGVPYDKDAWDEQIKEFYPHRHLHSWTCQNALWPPCHPHSSQEMCHGPPPRWLSGSHCHV